ncbi:hypothetical protein PSU4_21180 [Pseudonocardia sulfidoxydans NBRC 16205]|uniref:ABC transmembrane type-1 domain-containing protein n=1 Tax=Pseudonocardia sulfidoxydans NBRC 16205 TaxID=1223511 RepID=A0A511DHC9_9PSEU|nr:hypothetical protein PSU4_21180 [Pseudonocardia sulfidoxydans NBRC 16205]
MLRHQLAGALVVIGLWALLTYPGLVNPFVLPTPTAVLDAVVRGLTEGSLGDHVLRTSGTFVVCFALAVLLGIALGATPGLVPSVHRSVEPLISLALSVPIVTYFAFLVVLLGYGFWSVLALGVVTATPTMITSTVTAFQEVDAALLRVGAVYTASRPARFLRIVLPGSLATLSGGVRIAAGRALIGVIVGEMFLSSEGLGAQIVNASGFFDIPAYYAVVVALAVISYVVAVVFGAVENRTAAYVT